MTGLKALLVQLGVFLVTLILLDQAFAWYAPRHYVPTRKMEMALAAGDGCLLILGDSRMVAAYDAGAFAESFKRQAAPLCVADLAIGAMDISGIAIAAREYLEHGRKPRAVLLGVTADSLLPPEQPNDPSTLVGNKAIALAWSHRDDVTRLFPGFPAAGIGVFDQGFRFLAGRSNAIGTYASLAWEKVQRVQNIITGAENSSKNSFGEVREMTALAGDQQRNARARLLQSLTRASAERESPWFREIEHFAARNQAPLLLVELPMPAAFRRDVTDSADAVAYRAHLAEHLNHSHGNLIDLSEPAWIKETHFLDGLHLTPEGGKLLSADLGTRLGALLH